MDDWRLRAACLGQPQSLFFVDVGKGDATARLMCAGCPVRDECLDFAIRTNQEYGIWAGMNARERRIFEDNERLNRMRASAKIRRAPVVADAPLADRQTATADGR